MLSLPAATSRKKPITISCSSSFWPSTSAWTSTLVRSSVGFSRRSAIIRRQRSKISGMSLLDDALDAAGVEVGVAGAERRVHQRRPRPASSSSGMPMKLPITRETTGWATSATRSQVSRPSRRSSTSIDDLADRGLVRGDPLGREAGLEQHLQAVVLGRVHADEHRAQQLEREALGHRGDAAELGRVRLPVAADRVDVVGPGDRPEAGLVRVLGDRPTSSAPGTRARICANSSCGGPSSQCSRSPTRT